MKKLFFVGMNRIATKSFHHLFNNSGYKSYHYSCMDVETQQSIILAEQMQANLDNYHPVLDKMDNAQVYSDMFWHREHIWIDGVKMFREIHNQYPDSYFVLQTRDMDAWLNSKRNHKKGDYIKRCMEHHQLDEQYMLDWFACDREMHESLVRKFFRGSDKFLDYDLDKDHISKLIDFVRPDFFLDEKHWGHYK